jgi:3-hydroxyacyl-[acyl-carrier-protein] dehydratase
MTELDYPDIPKMPMGIHEIQQCIPHRFPFLFIDRVVDVVRNERIVATKNVSITDPLLQGHFPDQPVVPGVIIVEALAQTAAVLGHLSTRGGLSVCRLTEINSARFKRAIIPGDTMLFELRATRKRPPFFWFDAECKVDGELATRVQLSALVK